MKWFTHLLTSFCFVYILSNFLPISYLGFAIAIVSSILPDYLEIISRMRHRSVYFHNWLIPLATIILIPNPTLAGFSLGYGHHLAIDNFTKSGVYISKRKIRGFLNSFSIAHNVIVILVHYLALMILAS